LDLAGCTAARQKALVDVQYKDIEFQLFLPPIKGRPQIIVMRLNLKRIKRTRGKRKK
jgi:hypothetical protein